jgi:ABC-type sugar transport system ATPase subunit/ribose/xylose/arabinose/galactoside ABC-type transport system permease subunit
MSAVVELAGIGKAFPGVRALQDVDLALRAGSIHALVGENGAGKSTLINILSGVLAPDTGTIRVAGHAVHLSDARAARRHGIVTVHQEVDLFPDLSVMENVGLEQGLPLTRLGTIDWRAQRRRTRAALDSVGEELAPGMLAGSLTPAQRQMVEIAAAVSQAAKVLILDEPTSSLSEAETQVLFKHLRRFRAGGTAIVYVSHRLEEIFALADEVTVLRDGRRVWTGPLADSSPRRLIGLMVGREVPGRRGQVADLPAPGRSATCPTGPVRLSCRGLTAADGGFADVSLEARAGEVLGLYGLIGAGRSEWAQAVFGLRRLASGEVRVDGRTVTPRRPGQMARHGLAYVPEDRLRQGLCRKLPVRDNAVLAILRRLAWGPWVARALEARRTRTMVEQLAIRLRSIEQPAGTLSGGNQQKVVLGRWLGCDPAALILDEPTRGVDVGAKAEIHGLIRRLAGEGRAVVLISSDLPEVVAQSDRVGVFREGRLVGFFDPRTASAEEIAAAAIPVSTDSAVVAWSPDRATGLTAGLSAPKQEETFGRRGGVVRRPRHNKRRSRHNKQGRVPLLRELALLGIVLVFCALLQWRTGAFLQPDSARERLTDAALLGFAAVGATVVILAGGLDISLGQLMALSAGVAGRLWEQGYPLPVVAAVAVGIGAAGSLLNACLSLAGRVHPIVVTLGTMYVYHGLTLWWLQQDVNIPGAARNWIFAQAAGLPVIAWSGLGLVVLTWAALHWTRSGRELYALGSNPAAAHRVSIERWRVWLKAFAVQGVLVGLAGLLLLARSGNLQPNSYEDRTLTAIAAAVVGGVAITGGRGSVWGVALGCLFLVSLAPACVFLHVSTQWQRTLVGGVMVVAVLVDSLWRRRGS